MNPNAKTVLFLFSFHIQKLNDIYFGFEDGLLSLKCFTTVIIQIWFSFLAFVLVIKHHYIRGVSPLKSQLVIKKELHTLLSLKFSEKNQKIV